MDQRNATAKYMVLLTVLVKLIEAPDKLDAFLMSQPDATSTLFLGWLADMESKAKGRNKQRLEALCEALVTAREVLDIARQDELYVDSLAALEGGAGGPAEEQRLSLVAADPQQYSSALARTLTGHDVAAGGFGSEYDLLLKVAPPAALTEEGVKQGHDMAAALGRDLAVRRKRSLAAVVGRHKLTEEAAQQLLAGSAASRILDMLLGLESDSARLACLPDCFTAPPAPEGKNPADVAGQGEEVAGQGADVAGQGADMAGDEELLWCSPLQLLNEVQARLKASSAPATPEEGAIAASMGRPLLAGGHTLKGGGYERALRVLSDSIRQHWLDGLDGAADQQNS